MPVIAGGRGSTRSKLAAVRGYRDARGLYDTELMRELLATPPADAIQRPRDREAVRGEAPPALRQAMEILERVASVEERAVYRRFVLTLARGGGARRPQRRPAGTPPPAPGDSERDALRAIAAILDR